ncbi:MAG: hypothetical protein VX529_03920 [Pseudomonadota bacterium]|nr:hypothetical protein [Pseudomonadota bacterium]
MKRALAGLAALGLASVLAGPALAQTPPEGVEVTIDLRSETVDEYWFYKFQSGGALTIRVLTQPHDGRPFSELPESPVGQWSLDADGALTVSWNTGETRHCDAWPDYGYNGTLDGMPDGTCWLSDDLVEAVQGGALTSVN